MRIVIPGKPIAKKRPRFARRGEYVAVINQQATEEGHFLLLAIQLSKAWEITQKPIKLQLKFIFARPKSHFNSRGNLKPSAPLLHIIKPDLDNLEKFAEDALKGLIYVDDCQVCHCTSTKEYSSEAAGLGARTEIFVTEL